MNDAADVSEHRLRNVHLEPILAVVEAAVRIDDTVTRALDALGLFDHPYVPEADERTESTGFRATDAAGDARLVGAPVLAEPAVPGR
ncbi:hypothetical protein AVP42_00687 [Agromyces sp. NDB4Y10]|uniref:hypothetical protein n=1 Tax=Agromyces sp. NDB4Y10 TaxID=1775951 RepID=UPI0007B26698|nr:hypothetical protein [Agromyces sp. NDB4Y10]KZE94760.1 hypothetical protein AVP42_00687 [Agromyces sp. NDB4Y10]